MPYAMRKIKGKDLYKVWNTETGEVKSSGSTKKDAKAQLRLLRSLKGGSLKADQIREVLENSYKETDDAPSGYTLDKDLSDDRVKVYKDMNSDQVIVAHRGSKGWRDWLDNARYAYSGDITTSGTYQDAKKRQQKAVDKYGAKNIISVGHSRAGKYVEELNKEQPVKEVITYNKAAHPNTVLQTNPENQTDIRTSTDVVSALSPFQFSKNKTVTIPSGWDLLKAHKPSALSYLGNKLIGKGYKQMRVGDMRRFIKAYKKEKYGEKMKGGAKLGKKELIEMMNPIMEDDDLDEMVGGSVWTDFVKEFAARHGLKYACALSKYKEPLKKAYKLSKEKKDWYVPLKQTSDMNVGTDPEPAFEPASTLKEGLKIGISGLTMYPNPLKNRLSHVYQHPVDGLRSIQRGDLNKIAEAYNIKGDIPNLNVRILRKLIVEHENRSDSAKEPEPEPEPKPKRALDYDKRGKRLTELRDLKLVDLRKIAKEIGIKKYSTTKWNELVNAILNTETEMGRFDPESDEYKYEEVDLDEPEEYKYEEVDLDEPEPPKLFEPGYGLSNIKRSDLIKMVEAYKIKGDVRKLNVRDLRKLIIESENEPDEPEEMRDMQYRPKITRELRRALELELASKPSRLSQLPPIRGDREEELMEMETDELKDIVSDNNIKTKKKSKQALIDAILLHEGEVKGIVLPQEQYDDLVQLYTLLKLKGTKGTRVLSALFQNLANQKNKLKEMRQEKNRDLFGERMQQDRISKMEDYIKLSEKLLLKDVLKGKGVMTGGNKWTDFVKDIAKRGDTTYGCALSDPGTKNAYKLFKDGKEWWFPKAKEMETQTDFVDPVPIPAPVNIAPVINKIEDRIVKLEKIGRENGAVYYDPANTIAQVAFVNLMKKYGAGCIVNNINSSKGINVGIELIDNPKKSVFRKKTPVKRLGEQLKECITRGVQLIAIPLRLTFDKSISGHANVLVFRPFKRLVERFEPHGQGLINLESRDTSFNTQLKQLFEVDLKPWIGEVVFKDPKNICPIAKGFQALEEQLAPIATEGGGFCSMWSIFFTEMVFLNPDKSTKEIFKEVLDLTKSEPEYLKSLIRGYVLELEKELDTLTKLIGDTGKMYWGKDGFNFKGERISMYEDYFNKWVLSVIFESKSYQKEKPEYE